MTLEETLISVWRQALVDQAGSVKLENQQFPVRQTTRSRLRQVDFRFRDQTVRGLEQNPDTRSRWAQLARQGMKVMQFLSAGHYVAVVVEGKVQFYGPPTLSRDTEGHHRPNMTWNLGDLGF